MSDLSLYSSPSMPNISLGRPPSSHGSGHDNKLASVSEAEVRAAFTARLGMPLTGQMLPGTLPFYPTLPGESVYLGQIFFIGLDSVIKFGRAVIDSESGGSTEVHKQMQSLEQSGSPTVPGYQHMTDSQVAHARLNKHGHRPLGRTQSAPLPLGHPMLTSHTVLSIPQHYDDQRTQHNLLKQVKTEETL